MMGAGGDFVGLGLPAMTAAWVLDAIELCLRAAHRRAAGQSTARRRRISRKSDLGVLRDVLIDRGYAPGTAAKYVACVARFLGTTRCAKPEALTDDDVVDYLAQLAQAGLGNASLRLHLCALRTVFDRLLDLRITVDIQHAPRPLQRPPATEQEVRLLMTACRSTRDRFVIDVLNRTKLMPGKLRLLAAPPGASLFAGRTGGDTQRQDQNGEPVSLAVASSETDAVAWVLPSPRGDRPLSNRTVRRIVERVSKSCGVRTTCTALRKAEAVPWRAAA